MAVNNPYQKYKKTEIGSADQSQLILMLYDGAIRSIKKAIELLPAKADDIEKIHKSIVKAQDIVVELISSLNMDTGDIAQNLLSIYMYINTKLAEANIKKAKEPLEEVLRYLTELRGAWNAAAEKERNSKNSANKNNGGINIAT